MSDPVGMSFKAKMNNLAKKLGLRPQTVIQNFMRQDYSGQVGGLPRQDGIMVYYSS